MSPKYGSDLDDYGFERYEENEFPIAYLLTWRTYGTWLPGDERKSVQRARDRRFGTISIEPSVPLVEFMSAKQRQPSFELDTHQRNIVEESIKETCVYRCYKLSAANVRMNHAHVVASAMVKPEKIVNDLKAYATRRLRAGGSVGIDQIVWSRGASTRYLWKPAHVAAAIEYVLYSQGDLPFELVTELPEG
jgi:REP element-mobilizing transposase RayT